MKSDINTPEYLILFKSKMDIIKSFEKKICNINDPILYLLISNIMSCMKHINFFLLSIIELDPIILFFKELFSYRFSVNMKKRNVINLLINSGIYFNWSKFFPYFFSINNGELWYSIVAHLIRNYKYCRKNINYFNYSKNDYKNILYSIINKSYFFAKLDKNILKNIEIKIRDTIFDISIINNELSEYYLQYFDWISEIKKFYIILASCVRQNKINKDIACFLTTYIGNNMKGTYIKIKKFKMDSLIFINE